MVFFFFLPNLSYFECERRNQRQTLSQRRWGAGEADVLIYSTLRLFIKAHSVRQPAKHLISLSRLPHLDLHFVGYIQRPGARSLSNPSRTNVLAARSLSAGLGLGHLSCRDSLPGYFWRLGKNCVLFIKTHIQWGLIRWTG